MKRIGAVEAGGTKFVCAVFEGDARGGKPFMLNRTSIPTSDPSSTLAACEAFFADCGGRPDLFGIASFGPIDCIPSSPAWGRITTTPKRGWRNTDLAGFFGSRFGAPVAFDTDVNGAALAEGLWGNGADIEDFAYVTIGTGIGGGIISNGRIVHGAMHPELGHFKPRRMPGDGFEGVCPFHGDCLEGLASGTAIEARWKTRGECLPNGHPAWALEAGYLAKLCAALAFIASSKRVLLGGSVGLRPGLVEAVRQALEPELKGYLNWLDTEEARNSFVMRPALGTEAGILGAAALALQGAREA